MHRTLALLIVASVLGGCAAPVVTWQQDDDLVPYPCIDGECYALTEGERDTIGRSFALEYCPVDLNR